MNAKTIRLIPILGLLIVAKSFAQSAQVIDNNHDIGYDITANYPYYAKLEFWNFTISSGLEASGGPYDMITPAEIDYVETDGVTLLGTNVSESSSSPIEGSTDLMLTSDPYALPYYLTSTAPDFDSGVNYEPVSGTVTEGYQYYYNVTGSGEIMLNYDLSWSGAIDGNMYPDYGYEDKNDCFDSGYLSLDTGINVSDLPVLGGGGGGD